MEKNKLFFDGSPPLPEEIILFEIFPRLPVKSLHRVRCVSKFCRSLTSHPPFLAAFSRCADDRYILSFSSDVSNMQSFFFYSNPKSQSPITDKNTRYSYIKFINGLTCWARGTHVTIRHVATNEEIPLPPPPPPDSQLDINFFYFCFDPRTFKYKVLVTTSVRFRVHVDQLMVIGLRLSIFTLNLDKSWRNSDIQGLYQLGKSKSVCIDGVLFCTNFSTSNNIEDGVIAAYVVGGEYFDIVNYPKKLSQSRYNSCHVVNVKESLAIVDVQDVRSCGIRLWIKVKEYWSKSWVEHRIEIPSSLGNIFNVSCNFSFSTNSDGEIVIGLAGMSSPRCWVFCHKMETGKWRRIKMVGLRQHVIVGDFVVEECVETPLLLRDVLKIRCKSRGLCLN